MFDAFFAGLLLVFQWPSLGFLFVGVFIGIWLGAIPGLGGILGLVLLLPFTYGMETVSAFALLLGMFAVTTTSDTISSVMLGIPGTAASQAIVLDGHPLAMRGEATRAFGASFTVSAMGGLFGALVMALSLPVIKPFILSFNSPEIFMLGVLGLSLVGSLSGASILKGMAIAAFGLLVSAVGYAPTVSEPRFHFDTDYLLDGLPLIPVVLGLFGLPELLEMAVRNTSISRVPLDQTRGGGTLQGIRDALRHWWLAIRCAAIGTYVGILPGLGGSIVDWIAYAHTVQSAKDKSRFGHGDIRGVIGADAANNASLGGALIPTVAFGIPGSLGAAILLGALVLQGLKPGPEMLTTKIDVTFSMVWSIIIANLAASLFLLFWARQVARMAFVPGHLVVPGVILFVFMGAWLGSADLGDWLTCLGFGVLGYLMKRGAWPRPPLVLALVLGAIMENSLIISLRIHDGIGWLTRPIVVGIMVLIVVTVVLSARGIIKTRRSGASPNRGEGYDGSPLFSLPLSLLLLASFCAAAVTSWSWSPAVGRFPVVVALAGSALVAVWLYHEAFALRWFVRRDGGLAAAARAASQAALLPGALSFFAYLAGMLLLCVAIGTKLGIPLFIAAYLRRWGGYRARVAVLGAALGWLLLIAFYDRVLHLAWLQPWLDAPLRALLPTNFPYWLVL